MDASPAPAPVATVPPRSIWIARPWIDLAATMARQTGAKELEQVAQRRLSQQP